MVIRVGDHREIQAAVLAMKVMDRTLASDINRATKAMLDQVWKPAVAANVHSVADGTVIQQGARVKAGNPPVAMAAQSRKALSGGLVPADLWAVREFGAIRRNARTTYQTHSRLGKAYTVTRRTRLGLPEHRASGRVALPAFAAVAPRAVALWVQMILAKSAEALGVNRG